MYHAPKLVLTAVAIIEKALPPKQLDPLLGSTKINDSSGLWTDKKRAHTKGSGQINCELRDTLNRSDDLNSKQIIGSVSNHHGGY